ncbi:BnaA01g28730D [Brassica napus]|uniref:BnaA01g28730D protein n=1 Tax=Brassica napus TaxID=3708 RepID=A0A078G405_BRANA|nr:BnaA01g28730D [Brassica napus]
MPISSNTSLMVTNQSIRARNRATLRIKLIRVCS